MVATIKSGRFSQKLTDVNLLSLKKATDLYNDSVNGYFDLLNESGCLLSSFAQNPNDDGKGGKDDNPKGKTAKNDPTNNLNQNNRQNYGGGGNYYIRLFHFKRA